MEYTGLRFYLQQQSSKVGIGVLGWVCGIPKAHDHLVPKQLMWFIGLRNILSKGVDETTSHELKIAFYSRARAW